MQRLDAEDVEQGPDISTENNGEEYLITAKDRLVVGAPASCRVGGLSAKEPSELQILGNNSEELLVTARILG